MIRKKYVLLPFFALGALFLGGLVVMLLWNAILPKVTNVGTLTYPQALGLLFLSRILFGGWRGNPGGHSRQRHHWRGRQRHNAYWREKWMGMSEEEKARFREEWQRRCGKKDDN